MPAVALLPVWVAAPGQDGTCGREHAAQSGVTRQEGRDACAAVEDGGVVAAQCIGCRLVGEVVVRGEEIGAQVPGLRQRGRARLRPLMAAGVTSSAPSQRAV